MEISSNNMNTAAVRISSLPNSYHEENAENTDFRLGGAVMYLSHLGGPKPGCLGIRSELYVVLLLKFCV